MSVVKNRSVCPKGVEEPKFFRFSFGTTPKIFLCPISHREVYLRFLLRLTIPAIAPPAAAPPTKAVFDKAWRIILTYILFTCEFKSFQQQVFQECNDTRLSKAYRTKEAKIRCNLPYQASRSIGWVHELNHSFPSRLFFSQKKLVTHFNNPLSFIWCADGPYVRVVRSNEEFFICACPLFFVDDVIYTRVQ